MADQVDPPPLFENVDIDIEKDDDLFVSAISGPQVIDDNKLILNNLLIIFCRKPSR